MFENRYNEHYFDELNTFWRLKQNTNFLRLYTMLINWNNNPLYLKDEDRLHLFQEACVDKISGDITKEKELIVTGYNYNGESLICTEAQVGIEIEKINIIKLFNFDSVNGDNLKFFSLMVNAFKNFLFHYSGLKGIQTLDDISYKLMDKNFFYEHVIEVLNFIKKPLPHIFEHKYNFSSIFSNYNQRCVSRIAKNLEHSVEESEFQYSYYNMYGFYNYTIENNNVNIKSFIVFPIYREKMPQKHLYRINRMFRLRDEEEANQNN